MQLKLVCECGTINDNDAMYCKKCGKGKDGVSSGVTKMAELAKMKTWSCMKCGNETAEAGLCSRCRNIYAGPLSRSDELVIRY